MADEARRTGPLAALSPIGTILTMPLFESSLKDTIEHIARAPLIAQHTAVGPTHAWPASAPPPIDADAPASTLEPRTFPRAPQIIRSHFQRRPVAGLAEAARSLVSVSRAAMGDYETKDFDAFFGNATEGVGHVLSSLGSVLLIKSGLTGHCIYELLASRPRTVADATSAVETRTAPPPPKQPSPANPWGRRGSCTARLA